MLRNLGADRSRYQFSARHHSDADLRSSQVHGADLLINNVIRQRPLNIGVQLTLGDVGSRTVGASRLRFLCQEDEHDDEDSDHDIPGDSRFPHFISPSLLDPPLPMVAARYSDHEPRPKEAVDRNPRAYLPAFGHTTPWSFLVTAAIPLYVNF